MMMNTYAGLMTLALIQQKKFHSAPSNWTVQAKMDEGKIKKARKHNQKRKRK